MNDQHHTDDQHAPPIHKPPSVHLQPVVRWPDHVGFWWVNDKARYGWQPIEVVRDGKNFRMYEFGCAGPIDIPNYWAEFVRMYPPNPTGQATATKTEG